MTLKDAEDQMAFRTVSSKYSHFNHASAYWFVEFERENLDNGFLKHFDSWSRVGPHPKLKLPSKVLPTFEQVRAEATTPTVHQSCKCRLRPRLSPTPSPNAHPEEPHAPATPSPNNYDNLPPTFSTKRPSKCQIPHCRV